MIDMGGRASLHVGDCREWLATLAENSIDSFVTDPPYELTAESRNGGRKPKSLRKGANHCLANLLGPSGIDGDADGSETDSSHHRISLRVSGSIPQMFGPIEFQDKIEGGEVKVNNESSASVLENMLMDGRNADAIEHRSNIELVLRKRQGFTGCVGVCTCYTEAGDSTFRVPIWIRHNSGRETKAPSELMAGEGAVVRAVLRLDLRGGTAELLPADGADHLNLAIELLPTHGVGAVARAGGFAPVLEAGGVGLVDNPADGARPIFGLRLHQDSRERLNNPTVTSVGFMSKRWDGSGIAHDREMWALVLRALKPGGHLVAFAGDRTYHRLACAVEDAGFEIRGMLSWCYFSGFPKSLDVSKQIDASVSAHWLNVSKAIDETDVSDMMDSWKKSLVSVQFAIHPFPDEGGSALASAPPHHSPERWPASAPTAPRGSSEAPRMTEGSSPSALEIADETTTASSARAITAETKPVSPDATPDTRGSSVPCGAWGSLDASTRANLKGAEALLTWLGSKQSSRREATAALCAALTDDWKLITSSPSEPIRNCATTLATECVSATTAITTAFTAESLISFTVATAKSKALDAVAGAAREVVGTKLGLPGYSLAPNKGRTTFPGGLRNPEIECAITAPATDLARQWDGWGTALKPAVEPMVLARKPLSERTVAANVTRWGTGALNIDACRFAPGDPAWVGPTSGDQLEAKHASVAGLRMGDGYGGEASVVRPGIAHDLGRFPANLYYCPKASRRERERGCDGLPARTGAEAVDREEGSAGTRSPRAGAGRTAKEVRNSHPTLKPLRLMAWLARLVTPPGGLMLDPFAGSGTAGCAAVTQGFRYWGAEVDPEGRYQRIAEARIRWWAANGLAALDDIPKPHGVPATQMGLPLTRR